MKKLAVYAEGRTEQVFIGSLLKSIAGANKIQIVNERRLYGSSKPRKREIISYEAEGNEHLYYAQVINCTNDERVKSDLLSEHNRLVQEGFGNIIVIRDARGMSNGIINTFADVPKLKKWMKYGVPTKDIEPTMVLAVMETEAWFIAETGHFSSIGKGVSLDEVSRIIGFDPVVYPHKVETIETPSELLNQIYSTVGESYDKTDSSISRTVKLLDIAKMYLELADKIPHLSPLMIAINQFFS